MYNGGQETRNPSFSWPINSMNRGALPWRSHVTWNEKLDICFFFTKLRTNPIPKRLKVSTTKKVWKYLKRNLITRKEYEWLLGSTRLSWTGNGTDHSELASRISHAVYKSTKSIMPFCLHICCQVTTILKLFTWDSLNDNNVLFVNNPQSVKWRHLGEVALVSAPGMRRIDTC